MMKQWMIATTCLGLVLATGCSKKGSEAPASPPPSDTPAANERPSLTSAECEAKEGTIVGDIGDGAIHRPDYRCENGEPPIGSIRPVEGEPIPIEGSVCCPKSAS